PGCAVGLQIMSSPHASQGLLQAILDDPENDTLRLIYADWLEDHDQLDRAEFIRVQCAIARLEEDDPERLPLQRREWELLQKNKEQWTPPFARAVNRFDFRRGFVSHVTMSAAKFGGNARAMFRKAPTIHQVTLENLTGQGHRLRDGESLTRVTHLDLADHFPMDWMEGLLDCPHLPHFTHLSLPLPQPHSAAPPP